MEHAALRPGRYRGTIVLADISGYTSFLDAVRVAHEGDAFADGQIPDAYGLISSLLDGIATDIDPPMVLVKFEGDAVFAVADEAATPRGDAMLNCVQTWYGKFRTRLAEAGSVWTCTCDACGRKDTLDLKFIVHYGDYFVQTVGRHIDVLSPDVTLAHRLLKNDAAALVGSPAYALFSESVVDALALTLPQPTVIDQPIDGMQPVTARAIALN